MEREYQISMTVDDYEPMSDSDCESSAESALRQSGDFSTNGMVRMERDHRDYDVVRHSFLAGMGNFGKEVNLVAIHKHSYFTVSGKARLEAFRLFSTAVATKRGGDPNFKNAWFAATRDEIFGIGAHGFGRSGDFEDGVSHGVGVHLSPENFPFDCIIRAKEDEYGVRHMMLCRVVLGNTETIAAGSRQFQPSSSNFDSGIDNPLSPRNYTIWSAYMNSHIFPIFIFSFTSPALPEGFGRRNLPNSPRMKLSVLVNVLSRFLIPSQMALISDSFRDFRGNRIGRNQLIGRLRNVVGDRMLVSIIKICKDMRT